MKIQVITHQNRRDFTAIMECEHCKHTEINSSGYDDDYYHKSVIPDMECSECGKKSDENYRPLTTKYGADEII